MIVESQTRLKTFQDAQEVYADYLRQRDGKQPTSFEEFVSSHEALEPMIRQFHQTLHDTLPPALSATGAANPGSRTVVGSGTMSPSEQSDATTVVDRRGARSAQCDRPSTTEPTSAVPIPFKRDQQNAPRRRYVAQGELARGGMGAVYKVWDRELRRTLAMKVLLDEHRSGPGRSGAENRARFLQEAQVITRLDHPGIVPVHDVGFDREDRPYFTMRYVDGLDLDSVFERSRTEQDGWNLSRAVALLVKTCQTVAYAHARGIIHRDLKPGNVMVGRYGEVYVIDWGLAKVLRGRRAARAAGAGAQRTARSVTSPVIAPRFLDPVQRSLDSEVGVVVGTPPYMPPEQAQGIGRALDPRADIYSLGAVLYSLLTGDAPYAPRDGRVLSAPEMTERVLEGPPPPVRELAEAAPTQLVAICERAMARDPLDRYRSALEMGEDLQSYLDGLVARPAIGVGARLKGWVRGHRALAGVAGVAIFLATLLPAVLNRSEDVDKSQRVEEPTAATKQAPEQAPDEAEKVAKSHADCGETQSS